MLCGECCNIKLFFGVGIAKSLFQGWQVGNGLSSTGAYLLFLVVKCEVYSLNVCFFHVFFPSFYSFSQILLGVQQQEYFSSGGVTVSCGLENAIYM